MASQTCQYITCNFGAVLKFAVLKVTADSAVVFRAYSFHSLSGSKLEIAPFSIIDFRDTLALDNTHNNVRLWPTCFRSDLWKMINLCKEMSTNRHIPVESFTTILYLNAWHVLQSTMYP